MKQQKIEAAGKAPASRPTLPDPKAGMPAVTAGEGATIHMLLAVCARLDRIVALEARLDALEEGAEGKNKR